MDSNDFIFSDDVAESLGFRMADADSDTRSAATEDKAIRQDKTGFAVIGGLGIVFLGLMAFWDRHPPL